MINTTISKYKITRLIGEGGMASVYEAEHEMLGTKVAIKVLNPILSANAQIRERFKNEAKMMASLNHPNITRVIDFDEQPQHLCIVMEYLEGEDLSQKIKRDGALSDKHINEVFTQTLAAFQYAHDKGIVHRDIKPSNIFILPDGQVKILDFGIAKLFGQSNEMTQTGTQMGTPTYMSPEQVKADKTIDNRSDIYSLGVTLYYAVNGKAPYNSTTESQFDIFNKIVYEPLPEITGNSKYNGIIKKACAKNREERFQNCNAWLSEMNNPSSAHASATPIGDDKTIFENKAEATIIENNKTQTITPKVEKAQPTSNTTSNTEKEKKKPIGLIIGVIAGMVLLIIIFIATSGPSQEKLIGLDDKIGIDLVKFDYYGFVSGGLPNGKGTATYYNGAKYEGGYKDGLREGSGTWTDATGTIFEGEFKNNTFYGHFKIIEKNGATSTADFISNYPLIEIGNQGWMQVNLNEAKFRNGDPIPEVRDTAEWRKAGENKQPAWCYYNNDEANAKYGKLYNWYAVNDARGLAPDGWHIPTDTEWTTLTDFLGGEEIAGAKMKSTEGWHDNGNGTNSSGFSGLPGGFRGSIGAFPNVGNFGIWWSSTEYFTSLAWYRDLYYDSGDVNRDTNSKENGFSVRCLRD